MIMYVINKIAHRLEQEKAKLEDLQRRYDQAGNLEPGDRFTFMQDIAYQKGAVETLISLLEELK